MTREQMALESQEILRRFWDLEKEEIINLLEEDIIRLDEYYRHMGRLEVYFLAGVVEIDDYLKFLNIYRDKKGGGA